ncbi:MAG: O-acetyl-ADP-ribose deacetylase [Oscillospiraceae bacterium]|nr:O-acetyl-ADP-ribose deacetylase [Oscillospiraceae bacterium]
MPFQLIHGDITKIRCDAIVNAANESLLGGGGVDGAIHRAAGPELLAECRTLGGCRTGQSKLTKGYRLPADYVIHTVGPIWQGGRSGEPELLCSCYRTALSLAAENGLETVAFPLISAGAYGYPEQEAQRIAVQTIAAFLETHPDMTVTLVIYDGTPDRRRSWYPEISELLDRAGKSGSGQSGSAFSGAQKAAKPRRRLFRNMNFAGAVRKETADTAAEIAADAEYCMAEPMPAAVPASLKEELLHADESFTQMLLRLIDAHGMTDAECYKKANIDRKLFSKIRSDIHYRPKKATAIAFAVALELSAEETEDLLRRAGYAFSPSTPFDIIVLYFIKTGNYNVFEINEALFAYDQVLIGA